MARTAVTDVIEKAIEIWDLWTEEFVKQYGFDLSDLIGLAAAQQVSDEVLKILTQMIAKFLNEKKRHEHKENPDYATAKEVSQEFDLKLRRLRVR